MGGEQVGYVTSVAEDLNSGPSAYTSSVLFFYMFVILDILPNCVIYCFIYYLHYCKTTCGKAVCCAFNNKHNNRTAPEELNLKTKSSLKKELLNLQHRFDIKLPEKKPGLSGIVQGRFGGELSGFSK